MNTKFEFTGEVKMEFGITLKRIKRISDGVIGGWIEKEINLSTFGNAWVSGDAQVFGNARVKISPINIIAIDYPVTITETHMSIGCQIKLHAEWEHLTENDAQAIDSHGKEFYRYFKHTLISLMTFQHNKVGGK